MSCSCTIEAVGKVILAVVVEVIVLLVVVEVCLSIIGGTTIRSSSISSSKLY